MSATNHTTNYELPIFVGSDKPAWLVDWNGAMTAIDTAIHQAEGKADQAGTDIGGIESSISTINSTLTSINNAVSQLRTDTNANTGSINTITSLIGNGEPTTTDKTLIGAINELNAEAIDHDLSAHSVDLTFTAQASGVSIENNTAVKLIANDDYSVVKVYGAFAALATDLSTGFTLSTGKQVIAKSQVCMPTRETALDIMIGSFDGRIASTGAYTFSPCVLRFNTDGSISILSDRTTEWTAIVFACMSLAPAILIMKDFGD